ncbi:sterile alpha motif and leucine zipper containing kinase AZK protein [Dioscorea alata]|uniref:Sterile alpha motif and leucine zipper containing kinase AZK protein n=1 Tax=Dioscorea alata TaxID=55571 RepID=A0ACB7TUG0_DIOAL|nr:sterile alpha motif and leucine zipper containing kinase AZK protein [Dioscorea alata]
MKAAKRMSLGCTDVAPTRVDERHMEFLSLRYRNYNVVNYDDKLTDGFYDVYGVVPNHYLQEDALMLSLVDLQAASVSDDIDYEVVVVNRKIDPALQNLERRAIAIASECRTLELGPIASGLIQKIADLVVDSMGGPVADADDMLRRWTIRSYELRTSLNTIVLPLGLLEVGLSRHRALLFKVLADRINLPCRLVKGSYYAGTDEGAVNLIKVDYDSEFIIDLMGAPGTLIPAEIPSSHLDDSVPSLLSSNISEQTAKDLCLALDKASSQFGKQNELVEGSTSNTLSNVTLPRITDSQSNDTLTRIIGSQSEKISRAGPLLETGDGGISDMVQTEKFETEFTSLLPSLGGMQLDTFGAKETMSSAQQMQVDDVSKYVVSAAKDPEFAQKLHAVLSENAALPPDPFAGLNPRQEPIEQKNLGKSIFCKQSHADKEEQLPVCSFLLHSQPSLLPFTGAETSSCVYSGNKQQSWDVEMNHLQLATVDHVSNLTAGGIHSTLATSDAILSLDTGSKGNILVQDCQESAKDSMGLFVGMGNNELHVLSPVDNEKMNPMLGSVAEYEIPWEDLQIGERIGLGSCGEVYRAEWNGTEVAVKKFLNQDLSGDAVEQFKCEVRIMLRLRHPNVVLFMGAVTRPPNLSILTEFLPRGSLYRLLHRPNVQLDEKRRLRMALDVAKGMNYLHTSHPTIVHRDLKTPNLLVDKNWVVKVCDFGLSRLKHHTFLSSKSTAGTPEWMAPEVLRNEPSNEKCDVYSFGVILWELATLRMPWSGLNPMQVVGAVGFQNRRLEIPEEVDPMVAQLISDCWQR